MLAAVTVILILCSVEPSKSEQNTALAFKQGLRDYSDPIAIESKNFNHLVQNSKVFVDNSLLIKDLLKIYHQTPTYLPMQILCPSKWGKSTNLDMLKTFLEIQVDSRGNRILPRESTANHRLFFNGEITLENGTVQHLQTPLLIARYKRILDKYQGQHPVIYVSFRDVTGNSYETIEDQIRFAISQAFKPHQHLVEWIRQHVDNTSAIVRSIENHELEDFQAYLYGEDSVDILYGLNLLYTKLRQYFKKDVFVLMDDYDKPVHSFLEMEVFPLNDVQRTIDLLDKLACNIFQENLHEDIGIIMGTFQLDHVDWNNYNHFYITDEYQPMRQYFGFSEHHVDILFEKCNITEPLSQIARQWYDGYETALHGQRFYNPSSIAYFLNEKQIDTYWIQNLEKDYIQNVLEKQPKFRDAFMVLLSKQALSVGPPMRMNESKFFDLRRLIRWENRDRDMGGILEYLISRGYLTLIVNSSMAKLPNYEVHSLMSSHMLSFYKRKYNIKEKVLQVAADALRHFIVNETTVIWKFRTSLSHLYSHGVQPLQDRNHWLYGLFDCVALRMQRLYKFDLDIYYNNIKRADYVIIDARRLRAFIVELTLYESSAIPAVRSAERFQDIFDNFPDMRITKVAGINLCLNNTVQVIVKLV